MKINKPFSAAVCVVVVGAGAVGRHTLVHVRVPGGSRTVHIPTHRHTHAHAHTRRPEKRMGTDTEWDAAEDVSGVVCVSASVCAGVFTRAYACACMCMHVSARACVCVRAFTSHGLR